MTIDSPYCSDYCEHIHEPVAGTVKAATHYLFIQAAQSRWPDSSCPFFSETEKKHIKNILKEKDATVRFFADHSDQSRLLLFMREGKNYAETEFNGLEYAFKTFDDIQAALSDFARDDLSVWKKIPSQNRFGFICLDGKHNACCAKFGGALLHRLEAEKFSDFTLLPSSHLGGDRFAPNMICFPEGVMYGRIRTEQHESFITALAERKIYTPALRGLCCVKDECMQTALCAALCAEGEQVALASYEIESISQSDQIATFNIHLTCLNKVIPSRFKIECTRKNFEGYSNCDNLIMHDRSTFKRWVGRVIA